ncbi:class I SAM-dependent methyltransferase [Streptomyces olivochromogenes]|uniref:class I SAM-dependent methyltransferase n=1 Tax=Streptomyces olivochromogenes TaxID=1963 RepID=UPI0036CC7D12
MQVEVVAGRAEKLPLEDDGFDVAVLSLVLCTFADVPGALAEARRVLKPGGKLLFYGTSAPSGPASAVQKALALPWRLIGGGCHLTRDTERAIQEAGFTVEDIRRFLLRDQRPSQPPPSPSIIGTGRATT